MLVYAGGRLLGRGGASEMLLLMKGAERAKTCHREFQAWARGGHYPAVSNVPVTERHTLSDDSQQRQRFLCP